MIEKSSVGRKVEKGEETLKIEKDA